MEIWKEDWINAKGIAVYLDFRERVEAQVERAIKVLNEVPNAAVEKDVADWIAGKVSDVPGDPWKKHVWLDRKRDAEKILAGPVSLRGPAYVNLHTDRAILRNILKVFQRVKMHGNDGPNM